MHNPPILTCTPGLQELMDFLNKAPIAMHWLSGTGHVLWANETELNVLGYTAEEYIGQVAPQHHRYLKAHHALLRRSIPTMYKSKPSIARQSYAPQV